MQYLTPAERRERLAHLLLRGIYLYAQKHQERSGSLNLKGNPNKVETKLKFGEGAWFVLQGCTRGSVSTHLRMFPKQ